MGTSFTGRRRADDQINESIEQKDYCSTIPAEEIEHVLFVNKNNLMKWWEDLETPVPDTIKIAFTSKNAQHYAQECLESFAQQREELEEKRYFSEKPLARLEHIKNKAEKTHQNLKTNSKFIACGLFLIGVGVAAFGARDDDSGMHLLGLGCLAVAAATYAGGKFYASVKRDMIMQDFNEEKYREELKPTIQLSILDQKHKILKNSLPEDGNMNKKGQELSLVK